MKHITKQQPPEELIAWTHARAVDDDGRPMAWGYDDMPGPVRQSVKNSLLREQGGLCCYTGRRITNDSSHIEHLKPQEICQNHEDTDYNNLLAAYPAWNSPHECPYGAHAKRNWYDQYLFISPIRDDCEVRFRYRFNGKISPARPEDQAACETVIRLNLDHKELKQMREAAIHTTLFEQRLGKNQVKRLMEAMDGRDGDGNFRQFCFAIKQACSEYLRRFG